MKKHKLVTMLSAAAFAVGLIGMTRSIVMAEEPTTQEVGNYGEDVNYTLDDEGVLTISGTGEIHSAYMPAQSKVVKLVIKDGITGIGKYTFWEYRNLREVTIPNSVTYIGDSAFENCLKLEEVILPDNISEINEFVFNNCYALKKVTIPNKVTNIEYGAFHNCRNLPEVNIPDNVEKIGTKAFENCSSISKINFPDSIKSIGFCAFRNCKALTNFSFNGNVPSLSIRVFENVTATAYYPAENDTWKSWLAKVSEDLWMYGEEIKWVALENITIQKEMTDTTYITGSPNGATIKCSGALEDFINVAMDNEIVDCSNYTLKEGSTILTFTSKYMDSLSAGAHTITLNYKNNQTVETILTVQAAGEEDTTNETDKKEDNTTSNETDKTEKETTNNESKEETTTILPKESNSSNSSTGNLNSNDSVKTGDSAEPILWILIGVFAISSCFVLASKKHSA